MPIFQKRLAPVQATQFRFTDRKTWPDSLEITIKGPFTAAQPNGTLGGAVIKAGNEKIPIVDGDWLVTEPDGTTHRVGDSAFRATYDPVQGD